MWTESAKNSQNMTGDVSVVNSCKFDTQSDLEGKDSELQLIVAMLVMLFVFF